MCIAVVVACVLGLVVACELGLVVSCVLGLVVACVLGLVVACVLGLVKFVCYVNASGGGLGAGEALFGAWSYAREV